MIGAGALLAGVALGGTYLLAEGRLARRGDRWPVPRTTAAVGAAAAVVGAGLLTVLVAPGPVPDVVHHLLLTMVAPLCLALSAPVSLALRTLPPGGRRVLLGLLRGRWARAVTWPPVAAVLEVAGLAVWLGVPAVHAHPWLHGLLVVHMAVAGWLFSTCVVALDPLPRVWGVLGRAVVLVVVGAAHGTLAKLDFARGGGDAAVVLSYGGDVVEVATAVALFAGWYARAGRDLQREVRWRARHPGAPVALRRPAGRPGR